MDHWSDDLFDRKTDATNLVAYVRSVYARGSVSGEEKSQVISIDAEYGIGKTFFLKRLSHQLSEEFPVAYVDAWADDFVNEPMVALAATLKRAMQPHFQSPDVSRKWSDVANKAGRIAWVGSKGLARQTLKFLISGGAVEVIEEIAGETEQINVERLRDSIKESLDSADESVTAELNKASDGSYMERKIGEYEAAKSAVRSLQNSLTDLGKAAAREGASLPIFVIIDELDRCRPSYSIKVLEEVKHVFSVPEVCFILGLNSQQLAASIAHEYGGGFDGGRYLDRFIDRTYRLPFPGMLPLVQALYEPIARTNLKELWFPSVTLSDEPRTTVRPAQWITALLHSYGIAPRSTFRFFDRLQTSLALVTYPTVLMPYLCELIAMSVSGRDKPESRTWRFFIPEGHISGSGIWIDGDRMFNEMSNALQLPRELRQKVFQEETPINAVMWEFVGRNGQEGAEAYHHIIHRLAHFGAIDEGGVSEAGNAEGGDFSPR